MSAPHEAAFLPIALALLGAADIKRYDPAGARTQDLRIKSPLLYQLSYRVGRSARNLPGDPAARH